MAKLANLARMTTATVGTGLITLGSAVPGFLTFAQAGLVNGDVVSYGIMDGTNSEVGTGTYTAAGTTLSRTVVNSTNGGSAISLSGTAQVFVTALKADFDEKAPLASPVFTGDPQAPTQGTGDNDTSIATTAFVKSLGYIADAPNNANYYARQGASWAQFTPFAEPVSDGKVYGRMPGSWVAVAPLASPVLTGDPQAPTPASTDNDTSIATSAFVKAVLTAGTYTTAIADGAVSAAAKIADGIITFAKMASSAIATTAEYYANTASKILTTDQVWASGAYLGLTDGATVTPDFGAGINFSWVLGAAGRTLANPTNPKVGQSGMFYINAGASGTITGWGTSWKFTGGVKPTLTPGGADVLCYHVRTTTLIVCTFIPDVR